MNEQHDSHVWVFLMQRYAPGEPEDHDEHVMDWLATLSDEEFMERCVLPMP